jgi:hypothetical protein
MISATQRSRLHLDVQSELPIASARGETLHRGAIADIFAGLLSLMLHCRFHSAKRLSKADLLPEARGFIPIARW